VDEISNIDHSNSCHNGTEYIIYHALDITEILLAFASSS